MREGAYLAAPLLPQLIAGGVIGPLRVTGEAHLVRQSGKSGIVQTNVFTNQIETVGETIQGLADPPRPHLAISIRRQQRTGRDEVTADVQRKPPRVWRAPYGRGEPDFDDHARYAVDTEPIPNELRRTVMRIVDCEHHEASLAHTFEGQKQRCQHARQDFAFITGRDSDGKGEVSQSSDADMPERRPAIYWLSREQCGQPRRALRRDASPRGDPAKIARDRCRQRRSCFS